MLDTPIVPVESAQFLPTDPRSVYLNYTNVSLSVPPVNVIEDANNLLQVVNFGPMTKAGNVSLVGSGILDSYSFNFTVLPGPISASLSQIANEQMRAVAGGNMTLMIALADAYGNSYNLSNSTADLQIFTQVS